jgi:hypothetical protein
MCFVNKNIQISLYSRNKQLNILKVYIFLLSHEKTGYANGITLKTLEPHELATYDNFSRRSPGKTLQRLMN